MANSSSSDLNKQQRQEQHSRTKAVDQRNPPNGREPSFSEDDLQREQLGPRGVPGGEDPPEVVPQGEKKKHINPDPGHTA